MSFISKNATRKCEQCGADISNKIPRAKYCSKLCSCNAWNKANRVSRREYSKAWYMNNRYSQLERAKNYRAEHPERKKDWEKANLDKISRYSRAWQKANPKKCILNVQRRRARKYSLPNTLTVEQWNRVLEYFDNRCAYCGKKLYNAHQEHFIPLSKGGGYTANNIVPSCCSCNSSKSNKDPMDWLAKQKNGLVIYERISQYLNNVDYYLG